MMMIPCVSVILKVLAGSSEREKQTPQVPCASGGPAAENHSFWCACLTGLAWTLLNPYVRHMQGGFAEDSGNNSFDATDAYYPLGWHGIIGSWHSGNTVPR